MKLLSMLSRDLRKDILKVDREEIMFFRQVKRLFLFISIFHLMIFVSVSLALENAQDTETVNGKVVRKAEVVDAAALDSVSPQAADPFGESWDPLEEMYRIQDSMNRIFQESSRRADHLMRAVNPDAALPEPAIRAAEGDDLYRVSIDMPGVKKEDIKVQIIERALVVSGVRRAREEEMSQENHYSMKQQYGKVVKQIPLPEDAAEDGIKASYEDGVLSLQIPKISREEPQPETKTIPVE